MTTPPNILDHLRANAQQPVTQPELPEAVLAVLRTTYDQTTRQAIQTAYKLSAEFMAMNMPPTGTSGSFSAPIVTPIEAAEPAVVDPRPSEEQAPKKRRPRSDVGKKRGPKNDERTPENTAWIELRTPEGIESVDLGAAVPKKDEGDSRCFCEDRINLLFACIAEGRSPEEARQFLVIFDEIVGAQWLH